MKHLSAFEEAEIKRLSAGKEISRFNAGDTIRVHVNIVEGTNQRIQMFEGVCIGRKNRGLHSSFRVRKMSFGEGVERIFPLYSPNVVKVETVKRGIVRRAKLYYMRGRTGKAARIQQQVYKAGQD